MHADLVHRLRGARRILVFTGAGISTSAGIPDFRGPSGVWMRRQPVLFADFLACEASRVESWDQKSEGFEAFLAARPTATHLALVTLERQGRLLAIVTQNIDGLHHAAGSSPERIIELHGTNRLVACLRCGMRADPKPAMAFFREHRRTPQCACGGWLKFATISFGQALDPGTLRGSFEAADAADLVLALGSTLSVHPAASVPLHALQRGVPYVIVNRGPTEHDELASLRIEDEVDRVVPAAIDRLGA